MQISMRLLVSLALTLAVAALALPVPRAMGQDCAMWENKPASPDARNQHVMAFDAARGRTVMFGGFAGDPDAGTWEFDGTGWVRRNVPGPSARVQAAMAYDSARGVCVLFGGQTEAGFSGETWEWNGTNWTQRAVFGPPGRSRHAMAYDSQRHVVVLFGGFDGGNRFDETWEYNGTTWTQRTPPEAPAPRSTPSMAYDSARQVCVLYGGFTTDGGFNGETWEWDGAAWTQRAPANSPGLRGLAAMSFDPVRAVTVLTGGSDGSADQSDTWEWNGADWTLRDPAGLPARESHSSVYDTVRAETLVFGGSDGPVLRGDMHRWDGTAWEEVAIGIPPVRFSPGLAYDSVRDRLVMFGGEWDGPILQTDMWEWSDGVWHPITAPGGPTPRAAHVMVYDPVRQKTLLFGGFTGFDEPGGDETWEWDGAAWTQRLIPGPSARYSPSIVFDSGRGVAVLFGGKSSGVVNGETWEWNGAAWTQRLIPGPPAGFEAGMAYDASRGVTVLFGGELAGPVRSNQTWEYDGTAWTQRIIPGPSPRNGLTLTYDSARGVCVLFGGRTDEGVINDLWEYDGAAWTQRTVPDGPSARYFHAAAYNPATAMTMVYGGRPVDGPNGETWNLEIIPPTIAQSPGAQTVCEGQAAAFSVLAAGSGPLAYQWRKDGTPLADGGAISGATTPTLTITGAVAADAGSYDVAVSSACGQAISAAAGLTVNTTPSISQPPGAQAVCAGQGAAFSITATGTGTLSYQWRRNGANLVDGAGISGATTATLAIASASPADAGSYDCVVTNACGPTTSAAAGLTVNIAPAVTQQPVPAAVCAGGTATFTVAATGTAALSYQWRHNGAPLSDGGAISGASTPTLTVQPVSGAVAGSYDCVITNLCGSVTSAAAALTESAAPSITDEPDPLARCEGQGASFTVAATGSGTLAYQWRRGGVNLVDGAGVSGATTATLTLAAVAAADAAGYDCIVTNTCGSATSAAASLTVNAAVAISQDPAAQAVCAGQPAGFAVTATGSGTLSYQWRRDGVALADGPGITGATSATLSLTAVATASAGSYDCIVSNECGPVTSAAATLTVNVAPTIDQQPAPASACVDGSASFTVAASGTGALSYQWRLNGAPLNDGPGIAGATTSTLSLTAIATASAGSYDCVVTNACGSITSAAAGLTVGEAPAIAAPPSPAAACAGGSATFTVGATGSGVPAYQWRKDGVSLTDGPGISGATTPTLILDPVIAADAGAYDCLITNECGSTTSPAAALTIQAPTAIAQSPEALTRCAGAAASFTVAATGEGALSYQWRRDGVPLMDGPGLTGATTATLSIAAVAPGDAGSYDCIVTGACGTATSAPAALAVEAAPTIAQEPAAQAACANQPVSFTIAALGSAPLAYQWRKDGVDLADGPGLSGATTATLTIAAASPADAGSYDCIVTNTCGSITSAAASLGVSAPPAIAQHPQPATLCAGQPAGFSVIATGTAPLTYQWRKDGVNLADGPGITGATAATLTLAAIATADAGSYDCIVTNECGAQTTSAASLTVNTGPSIAQHPGALDLCAGQPASFSVSASGTPPLAYQWRRNGVDLADGPGISGATTATLSLTAISATDAGTYDVIISDACSPRTSASASLTVREAPAITAHPTPAAACIGQPASLSVAATGTAPLTYQWRKDGVNLADGPGLSGAATPTLILAAAAGDDAGSYDCVIANACGTATSSAAVLTIDIAPSITQQPAPASACVDGSASFTIAASGTGALSYQWRLDGTPLSDGPGISGATTSTLSLTAIATASAGSYDCVVANACGSTTSAAVSLSVDVAPNISQAPAAATACAGQAAGFSVVASGSGTLAYQWRKDGVNLVDGPGIAGATTATLQLTDIAAAQAGTYDCIVTNTCGSATSPAAALTVDIAPSIGQGPTSSTVCTGQPATFTVSATGSGTLAYQWRKDGANLADGPAISGATTDTLTLATAAAADAGNYDCVVTNTCGSITSAAAALDISVPPGIAQEPQPQAACTGQPASFSVTATGTGALSYQWRKDGVALADGGSISGATTSTLAISAAAAADAGAYDCVVTNACGSNTSTAASLAINLAPSITSEPAPQTVCAAQPAAFTVNATGSGTLTYQWRKDGLNLTDGPGLSGATTPTLTIAAAAPADAGSYDCIITNPCGSATSAAAALTLSDSTAITTPPAAAERCDGQPATFTVAATGSGTLTYQWRKDGINLTDGGTISGATTAILSLAAVTATDAGSYDVIVTGACGPATSSAAALTVGIAPSVSQQPQEAAVCQAQPASFTVIAAGSGTLSYQWRRNGVDLADGPGITGATTASLSIAAAGSADAGAYDCIITNACGAITSATAALSVGDPTTIAQHPAAVSICDGQPAGFTIAATGSGTLAYQWRRDGVNLADGAGISGATTPTLSIAAAGAPEAGSYDCVVTGPCGAATSSAAALTIEPATIISQPPAALTRCEGQPASFTVTAAGSGSLTYQWRKDGVAIADGGTISGATTATLTIGALSVADAGNYDVIITAACGPTTSSPATLTVHTAPVLSQNPAPATICTGQPAGFSVIATGTAPLTYQWRKDGVNLADGPGIAGATTATLTLAAAATADAGAYDCIVTNECGAITTPAASLTVNTAPIVDQPPAAAEVCAGGGAAFTVSASGPAPLTYQWRRNGVNLVDGDGIAGATTANLVLSSLQAAAAGSYDCIVTGGCGSATSPAAPLVINLPPDVTQDPAPATACIAEPVNFTIAVTGSGTLNYQWRKDGVNLADGNGYSGTTTPTLAIAAATPEVAGLYDCLVSAGCGADTSAAASLTVNVPPSISQQPLALTRCTGQAAAFTVAASGSGTLAYQWRRDGVNLTDGPSVSGATTAALSLSAVAAADAGSYDCVITSSCGDITSSAAALTVNAAPVIAQPPLSQTICREHEVVFHIEATGAGELSYLWRHNGIPLSDDGGMSGVATPTLVIASVLHSHAGTYDCIVTNDCGSTTSPEAVLTVTSAPSITDQPDPVTQCSGQSAAFSVVATGTAPITYQWRAGGVPLVDGPGVGGATTASLLLDPVIVGDAGTYDCVITNSCGTVTSAGATLTVGEVPAIGQQPAAAAVCAGQPAAFTVAATGLGTLTYQWRKDGVPLADGAGITGATTPTLSIASAAPANAGAYDCLVSNTCGGTLTSAAGLTVNVAPVVDQSPSALTRCADQSAAFSVLASGTGPLAFQWRKDGVNLANGDGVSGANTPTLTLAAVDPADAGSYDCTVTNLCGSATSAAASLAVNTAPVITLQPAGHKRCAGQTEVLTVEATGTPPLTYQWRKDGVDLADGGAISGATSPNLAINPVATDHEGSYICIVTNACGTASTGPAALAVSVAPTIITHPTPATPCAGTVATFTVAATGAPPLSYHWRKNGVNLVNGGTISGATSATLTILSAAAADEGGYDCVVSNACGPTTSAAAALTLRTAPTITQQPAARTGCTGGAVTFTITADGAAPLTYQWRKDGVNLADGPGIAGATTAALVLSTLDPASAAAYDCIVSNPCGSTTSSAAPLTVTPGPSITHAPEDADVWTGQTITFTVEATGPGTLTYQWRRGGVPLTDGGRIAGATTPTLTITGAVATDSGFYEVLITSPDCGTPISALAAATVYCRADYDRNGQFQPADIAAYVNVWFNDLNNGTLIGDVDGNGAVEPADVSLFVGMWFQAVTAGGC